MVFQVRRIKLNVFVNYNWKRLRNMTFYSYFPDLLQIHDTFEISVTTFGPLNSDGRKYHCLTFKGSPDSIF